MRLASNKLKDIISFYHRELAPVYEKSEIDAMVSRSVEHVLGYSSTDLLIRMDSNVNQSDLLKLYDGAKALKQGLPLQYILGEAWFYDLKFKVTEAVLIPRPETEELVELVLKENTAAASFLDIGTGSGCIPVTLKKHLPQSTVYAADISADALRVAGENATTNNTDIHFFEADVLNTGAFLEQLNTRVEVIISNPPYIQASEKNSMAPQVLDHEPHLALFVEGDDPILFYKKITDLCRQALAPKGRLYFELNPLTAEAVKDYVLRSGSFETAALIKDLSGKTRFLKAVNA